jgi:site-specific DNA-methyltransferase (adenine-specific)
MNYKIINGNNIDVLKTYPDNYFDSIVTDPPYGIDFLGKAWDANTGALETYQQCLRVLKPGGHILAFSAARTYHHLAITLEQAGFEIRDQIMWIYSSGFPKSQDVGKSIERSLNKRKDNALGIKRSKIESGPKTNCPKCNKTLNGGNQYKCAELQCDLRDALAPADNEWAGWGTQLKPAHEPIALARKPIKLSIAKNCQEWGTGALNIDAARVPYDATGVAGGSGTAEWRTGGPVFQGTDKPTAGNRTASFHNATGGGETQSGGDGSGGWEASNIGRFPSNVLGDIPDYQKYFYCPKVSRKERHIGHDDPGAQTRRARDADGNVLNYAEKKPGASANVLVEQFQLSDAGNNHPTVKPIELMKYLIKLVTPANGIVLDPFNGSGSTGCAAVELGHEYVGIELDPAYVEIANKRIAAWNNDSSTFKELFE